MGVIVYVSVCVFVAFGTWIRWKRELNFLLQFVLIYMRLASYLNILWSLLALFFSLHSSVLCQLLLRLLLLRELKELMKFQLELYQFSWQARRRGQAGKEEKEASVCAWTVLLIASLHLWLFNIFLWNFLSTLRQGFLRFFWDAKAERGPASLTLCWCWPWNMARKVAGKRNKKRF